MYKQYRKCNNSIVFIFVMVYPKMHGSVAVSKFIQILAHLQVSCHHSSLTCGAVLHAAAQTIKVAGEVAIQSGVFRLPVHPALQLVIVVSWIKEADVGVVAVVGESVDCTARGTGDFCPTGIRSPDQLGSGEGEIGVSWVA